MDTLRKPSLTRAAVIAAWGVAAAVFGLPHQANAGGNRHGPQVHYTPRTMTEFGNRRAAPPSAHAQMGQHHGSNYGSPRRAMSLSPEYNHSPSGYITDGRNSDNPYMTGPRYAPHNVEIRQVGGKYKLFDLRTEKPVAEHTPVYLKGRLGDRLFDGVFITKTEVDKKGMRHDTLVPVKHLQFGGQHSNYGMSGNWGERRPVYHVTYHKGKPQHFENHNHHESYQKPEVYKPVKKFMDDYFHNHPEKKQVNVNCTCQEKGKPKQPHHHYVIKKKKHHYDVYEKHHKHERKIGVITSTGVFVAFSAGGSSVGAQIYSSINDNIVSGNTQFFDLSTGTMNIVAPPTELVPPVPAAPVPVHAGTAAPSVITPHTHCTINWCTWAAGIDQKLGSVITLLEQKVDLEKATNAHLTNIETSNAQILAATLRTGAATAEANCWSNYSFAKTNGHWLGDKSDTPQTIEEKLQACVAMAHGGGMKKSSNDQNVPPVASGGPNNMTPSNPGNNPSPSAPGGGSFLGTAFAGTATAANTFWNQLSTWQKTGVVGAVAMFGVAPGLAVTGYNHLAGAAKGTEPAGVPGNDPTPPTDPVLPPEGDGPGGNGPNGGSRIRDRVASFFGSLHRRGNGNGSEGVEPVFVEPQPMSEPASAGKLGNALASGLSMLGSFAANARSFAARVVSRGQQAPAARIEPQPIAEAVEQPSLQAGSAVGREGAADDLAIPSREQVKAAMLKDAGPVAKAESEGFVAPEMFWGFEVPENEVPQYVGFENDSDVADRIVDFGERMRELVAEKAEQAARRPALAHRLGQAAAAAAVAIIVAMPK